MKGRYSLGPPHNIPWTSSISLCVCVHFVLSLSFSTNQRNYIRPNTEKTKCVQPSHYVSSSYCIHHWRSLNAATKNQSLSGDKYSLRFMTFQFIQFPPPQHVEYIEALSPPEMFSTSYAIWLSYLEVTQFPTQFNLYLIFCTVLISIWSFYWTACSHFYNLGEMLTVQLQIMHYCKMK